MIHTNFFNHFQVEMLYQRYFLRMNQSNTTHILSLLLALVLTLVAVHIFFIPIDGGIRMTSSSSLSNATPTKSAVYQNRSSIISQNDTFNVAAARKEWKNQGEQQNADETEANNSNNIDIYNRTKEMVNHSYYGIANNNNNQNSLLSNLHLKYDLGRGMKRKKRFWANAGIARDQLELDELVMATVATATAATISTAAEDTTGNHHEWKARKQFKTYVKRK